MASVDVAVRIALEVHAGQVDKAGQPYILHPMRMAARFRDLELVQIALLHDVVEDSEVWTLKRLRQAEFSERVVTAVDALTRREGESYLDFIRRAKPNPDAAAVKLADLDDNTDPDRVALLPEGTRDNSERYAEARRILLGSG